MLGIKHAKEGSILNVKTIITLLSRRGLEAINILTKNDKRDYSIKPGIIVERAFAQCTLYLSTGSQGIMAVNGLILRAQPKGEVCLRSHNTLTTSVMS